jgi:hypothetical protein
MQEEISIKKGTKVDEKKKKCDSGNTDSLSKQQQQQQQEKTTNKRPRTRSMSRASSTNDDDEEEMTLETKFDAAIADADDGRASGGEEAVMDEHQSCADDMSGISDDEGSTCSATPPDRTSMFVDDKDKSNMTNSSRTNLDKGIVVVGGIMVEEKKNADDDDQSVAASSASSTAAVVVRGLRSSKQVKKRIRVNHCSSSSSSSNVLSPPLPTGEEDMTNNHNNTYLTYTKESRSYNVGTSIVTASTSHHGKKFKRRGFHYDYREVFLKSNVPQFIATLSGRIVVCE